MLLTRAVLRDTCTLRILYIHMDTLLPPRVLSPPGAPRIMMARGQRARSRFERLSHHAYGQGASIAAHGAVESRPRVECWTDGRCVGRQGWATNVEPTSVYGLTDGTGPAGALGAARPRGRAGRATSRVRRRRRWTNTGTPREWWIFNL